jgi:multiple sugar transport system permease protein
MINTTDMRTITVALRAFQTDYGTEWGLMMAGSLIAVVPMLIIFLSAQRYFVRRIATTGFGGR